MWKNIQRDRQHQGGDRITHTHRFRANSGLIWVVSRDGSSMSVQCVLRVFKWVKSHLWLPDGLRFDSDHSDRPRLWCVAAYYWHYRETGIFLPNHFQLLHTSPAYGLHQLAVTTATTGALYLCVFLCVHHKVWCICCIALVFYYFWGENCVDNQLSLRKLGAENIAEVWS